MKSDSVLKCLRWMCRDRVHERGTNGEESSREGPRLQPDLPSRAAGGGKRVKTAGSLLVPACARVHFQVGRAVANEEEKKMQQVGLKINDLAEIVCTGDAFSTFPSNLQTQRRDDFPHPWPEKRIRGAL